MIYHLIAQLVSLLLDLFTTKLRSEQQKDLEILLLRQQLRILQRRNPKTPLLSRCEKLGLAVLATKFTGCGRGAKTKLNDVLLLFKPDTVLKWHRDLVRRKWTFVNKAKSGRPVTNSELQELLLRLARENPAWGYSRYSYGIWWINTQVVLAAVLGLLAAIMSYQGAGRAELRACGWSFAELPRARLLLKPRHKRAQPARHSGKFSNSTMLQRLLANPAAWAGVRRR